MPTYSYSIATQTANGRVNLDDLGGEIRDLQFPSEYQGGTISGDALTLYFVDALSVPKQAQLTATVLSHQGDLPDTDSTDDPVGSSLLYFSSAVDPVVGSYRTLSSANDYAPSVLTVSAADINATAYSDQVQIKRFRLPTVQTILEKGILTIRAFIRADNDSEITGRLKAVLLVRDAGGVETVVLRETGEKKNFGVNPKKVFMQLRTKALLKQPTDSFVLRLLFVKEAQTLPVVAGGLHFMMGGVDCSRVNLPGRIL